MERVIGRTTSLENQVDLWRFLSPNVFGSVLHSKGFWDARESVEMGTMRGLFLGLRRAFRITEGWLPKNSLEGVTEGVLGPLDNGSTQLLIPS